MKKINSKVKEIIYRIGLVSITAFVALFVYFLIWVFMLGFSELPKYEIIIQEKKCSSYDDVVDRLTASHIVIGNDDATERHFKILYSDEEEVDDPIIKVKKEMSQEINEFYKGLTSNAETFK